MIPNYSAMVEKLIHKCHNLLCVWRFSIWHFLTWHFLTLTPLPNAGLLCCQKPGTLSTNANFVLRRLTWENSRVLIIQKLEILTHHKLEIKQTKRSWDSSVAGIQLIYAHIRFHKCQSGWCVFTVLSYSCCGRFGRMEIISVLTCLIAIIISCLIRTLYHFAYKLYYSDLKFTQKRINVGIVNKICIEMIVSSLLTHTLIIIIIQC